MNHDVRLQMTRCCHGYLQSKELLFYATSDMQNPLMGWACLPVQGSTCQCEGAVRYSQSTMHARTIFSRGADVRATLHGSRGTSVTEPS